MFSGNKGEWSEIYTLLKLLAEGNLYAADSDLNRIPNIYYPIIKILRNEYDENFEYLRDNQIQIVKESTGEIVKLPIEEFHEKSKILLNKIKSSKGAFSVSELEDFLKNINCKTLKAKSTAKSDIKIVVHDLITGFTPTLGFSIKSQLGSASTLLNAGHTTNIIYKIRGKILTDDKIKEINSISAKAKIMKRVKEIENAGCSFQYYDMECDVFKLNLQVIDSKLPEIISHLLVYYFKGKNSSITELLRILNRENPCQFNLDYNHSFYEYKIKKLLSDIALGMTPSVIWTGQYDATGGYIIVKEDGDVLCYHIYNQNEFEDYLLKNTKLETPSSSRHDFGKIYKENGKTFFKLNLQIRFL